MAVEAQEMVLSDVRAGVAQITLNRPAVQRIGQSRATDAIRVRAGSDRILTGALRLISAVLDCAKPVVCAVYGTAAGLGLHLALACDLIVAGASARFFEPFVLRGLVVDSAGACLLPRLIGLQRAKELAARAARG